MEAGGPSGVAAAAVRTAMTITRRHRLPDPGGWVRLVGYLAAAGLIAWMLAVSPVTAQPEDYEIHGGHRVGRIMVGLPVARTISLLGREEASGSWRTSWGQERALFWPRKGFNAKVCGAGDFVVEANVYMPRLPTEEFRDLMVEIGRYQIARQIGLRFPAALLPEYFGVPDEQHVIPSQLGATRIMMYWYTQGFHMETESGEVVEIGPVVIPPRCP